MLGILVSYCINSQNTHYMQKLFVIISAQLYVVFEIFLFVSFAGAAGKKNIGSHPVWDLGKCKENWGLEHRNVAQKLATL